MKSRIIKLQVSAHIIFEDGDDVVGETITKPIDIYRGVELTYEIIEKIEQLALQGFLNQRSREG